MVIDAKNSTRFSRDRLFKVSDYRTLIHEEGTGRQPIRELVLAHRDPSGHFASLPGYLEGDRRPPSETSVVAALPLLPDKRDPLAKVVTRFVV